MKHGRFDTLNRAFDALEFQLGKELPKQLFPVVLGASVREIIATYMDDELRLISLMLDSLAQEVS